MNKKLLLLIPFFVLLISCGNSTNTVKSSTNDTSDSSISEESSQTPTSSSESSQSEESSSSSLEDTITQKVTFKGPNTRSNMNSGAQLTNDGPKQATIDLFNETGEILTGLEASKVAYQRVGGDATGITSLTIGSSSAGGSLSLTFNVQIVEIKVKIQAYYNCYTSQGNDVTASDQNAFISIEGEEFDLSNAGNEIPGEYEKTISIDKKNTLSFSNDGEKQRVYIHELEFTYLA